MRSGSLGGAHRRSVWFPVLPLLLLTLVILSKPAFTSHNIFHWKGSSSTVARKSIVTDKAKLWDAVDEAQVAKWQPKQVVDEAAMLSVDDFPITPDELIMKAKIFLAYDQGVTKPELLSEEFEFAGPVVGPLTKTQYVKAVGGFHFAEAFPDANAQFHHFRVDPFEPSRVWLTARGYGTNSGDAPKSPLFAKPTGKSYTNPPQACSIRFDREGKVNQYTIGYVLDRRVGNTGGLGGIYGIAYALGKPLPFREARPWKPSLKYKFFMKIGTFLQKLSDKKETKN